MLSNENEKKAIDHEKSAYEKFEEEFKNSIFEVLFLLI